MTTETCQLLKVRGGKSAIRARISLHASKLSLELWPPLSKYRNRRNSGGCWVGCLWCVSLERVGTCHGLSDGKWLLTLLERWLVEGRVARRQKLKMTDWGRSVLKVKSSVFWTIKPKCYKCAIIQSWKNSRTAHAC